MLRRKPTALTITQEDITAFEQAHAQRVAYLKYLRTGEDATGMFARSQQQQQQQQQQSHDMMDSGAAANTATVDPNDELRPLPGDKARIVRAREERIMGAGAGAGSGISRR